MSPEVWALKAFTNSMMLMPCWPSAGPTGGAGEAWPPGACSLMGVRTFLAMVAGGGGRGPGGGGGCGGCGARAAGRRGGGGGGAGARPLAPLDLLHLVVPDLDGSF